MKRIFFLSIFIGWTSISIAQIGIGTPTPKATLDIQGKPEETSTVDGLMAPKISREQLIAKTGYTAAQAGAIIFVTDLSGVTNAATANITQAGYYYYNGSTWNSMNSGAITETDPTYTANFNLTGAATGDILQFNGTNWVAKKTGTVSVISKLADTPTTFVTIGDYQFRYSSTALGGFIEIRKISGYGESFMVFATKKTYTFSTSGSSTTNNYRSPIFTSSSSWDPLMTLWDGAAYNGRATLSIYETFEAHLSNNGGGSTVPSPLKIYKVFAAIDGYSQVVLTVEYSIN